MISTSSLRSSMNDETGTLTNVILHAVFAGAVGLSYGIIWTQSGLTPRNSIMSTYVSTHWTHDVVASLNQRHLCAQCTGRHIDYSRVSPLYGTFFF